MHFQVSFIVILCVWTHIQTVLEALLELVEIDIEVVKDDIGDSVVYLMLFLNDYGHNGAILVILTLPEKLASNIDEFPQTWPKDHISVLLDQQVDAAPVIKREKTVRVAHSNLP